jgi:hypothetical protein
MKRLFAFGLSVALLLTGAVAVAQDARAPGTSGQTAATRSMPMMTQMDEHTTKMQTLHDRMVGAATPEESQKTMEEARKEMQAGMAMMKPMMMQGGGMMGGGMMAQNGKTADTGAQMQMMRKRMDMMQMMMQMMMDQQAMMTPAKPDDALPKR